MEIYALLFIASYGFWIGVRSQFYFNSLAKDGELDHLERSNPLLDTGEDAIGLALMDEQLPQRVRTRKAVAVAGAL